MIGYYNIENNLLVKNSLDSKQGQYISESYRDYLADLYITSQGENIGQVGKLFEDLDYVNEYSIKDIAFKTSANHTQWPQVEIINSTIYKEIESKSLARIDVYNEILRSDLPSVSSYSIDENMKDEFLILKEKILSDQALRENNLNNILLESNYNIINYPSLQDDQYSDGVLGFNRLKAGGTYHLTGENIFGLEGANRNIYISGVFFNESVIHLNTNVVFDGIFISNNGSIIENGPYSFRVNGIFIEIGDFGSYPGISTHYRPNLIYTWSKDHEWPINYTYSKRLNLFN